MHKILVKNSFGLVLDSGNNYDATTTSRPIRYFEKGRIYEVPTEIANHWWVKSNASDYAGGEPSLPMPDEFDNKTVKRLKTDQEVADRIAEAELIIEAEQKVVEPTQQVSQPIPQQAIQLEMPR